jgi:hypothetical protein
VNCIPWDYPLPLGLNVADDLPLCMSYKGDGYTNTVQAFDEAMGDGNNTKHCENKCFPNCDETTYEYTIDTTELNTEELCTDRETKKVKKKLVCILQQCFDQVYYVFFKIALDLWRSTGNVLSWFYKQSLSDAQYVITTMDLEDGLNIGLADKICANIFKHEIAHMTLEIASPKVLEVVRDVKVTFPDMLGTIGMRNDSSCEHIHIYSRDPIHTLYRVFHKTVYTFVKGRKSVICGPILLNLGSF